MRKIWVFAFVVTTAMTLGAVFFGVSTSAATDTGRGLSTGLSGLREYKMPTVSQRGDTKPAALTASSAKRTAPEPEPADAAAPGTAAGRRTAGAPAGGGSELSRARAILAGHIARYPILRGTTVTFGNAQGHQAIAYYKEGRIVISASHTASLERILAHEVWHIIDWRDNGRIDWGENIPPR